MTAIKIYGFRGSKCPICKSFIALEDLYTQFNAITFKEYEESGLCVRCQDMVYGIED